MRFCGCGKCKSLQVTRILKKLRIERNISWKVNRNRHIKSVQSAYRDAVLTSLLTITYTIGPYHANC